MKLSKYTVAIMVGLIIIGIGLGIDTYLTRSDTIKPNDPAANAIAIHLGLAVVAIVAVAAIVTKSGAAAFKAPFTERAFNRTKATLLFSSGLTFPNVIRVLATLFLLYMMLWEPFRSAMQPIAALDPNFRANAWGGPSYFGATLAHWLDSFIIFYGAAFLLNLLLAKQVPHAVRSRRKTT